MRFGWPKRYPLVQFPNPPLIVALSASVVARLARGSVHDAARAAFYLALGVWAYQEIVHGSNAFRRALGLAVSVSLGVSLVSAVDG